jgi:hypothetical protein
VLVIVTPFAVWIIVIAVSEAIPLTPLTNLSSPLLYNSFELYTVSGEAFSESANSLYSPIALPTTILS